MLVRHAMFRLGMCALATSAAVACVGSIGEGGAGDGASQGGNGDGTSANGGQGSPAGSSSSAGPAALQRLRADEYAQSVGALLGLSALPALQLPSDSYNESGFPAPGNVTEDDASTLLAAADQIASSLGDADYARLSGCDPATKGEDTCADAFIESVATRGYRRPLIDEERADLRGVYDARKAAGDVFVDRMRLVTDTLLDAPGFLYHTEALGDPPVTENGLVKRGPYELAARLSYFLTRSPPDDTLWQAAKAGQLDTADAVATQVKRLLTTPAARTMVRTFTTQWLGIDAVLSAPKDPTLFPAFDADLRKSMHEETLAFASYVIFDGDQSWATLMTAPFSFLNAKLAAHYGVSGVTGTDLTKHDLDPSQRFGILTQGAVLASTAGPSEESPVKRGKLIEGRFLCHDISPPPKAFMPPVSPPGQTLTIRQRFEQLHVQPGCATCHDVLDPPGFAFGDYNAIGWYATSESGLPIDTAGAAILASGGTIPFTDAHGFVTGMVGNDEAQSCFARQWLRFALERREGDADAATVTSITSAFKSSQFNVQGLITAVATSSSFRYRAP